MSNKNAIYVTKPYLPPLDEYISYLGKIWDSCILTNNGALHQQFEQELCSRFDWCNVSLISNGHLALEIALKSLNLKKGGEIITTPFTFVSTVAAIVNQGFVPVFCDIGSNYTIDSSRIESLITEKTVAILPVHVYGFPCDVNGISQIAKKHDLKVLYDAAHALGVEFKGKDIANYGDITMFSFHATKLFHTIEGGALVYSDNNMRQDIELFKNFGISGPESIELIGMNAKMNEFQATMGLSLLGYMDEIINRRKVITERYLQNLDGINSLEFVPIENDLKYNYAYMPVLIKSKRDAVFEHLGANNIFARKYFYPILSHVDCFKNYLRGNSLERAEMVAEQIITLPIYPTLTIPQVDFICSVLQDALQ